MEGSVERKYAQVGTGNFNEKTANLYSDISLLTCDPKITNEVEKVFDFIDRPYFNRRFSTLVLSPFNTRTKFINYLNEEIKNAKKGLPAYAIIKLNNINDPELVRKLYEASCAGVKIKMIIRGVCSLVPGVKNLSENIEVISVIDRFLEHVRLFVFCNNSNPLYYIGSADWLTRNLDKRVEVTTPIFDKRLQKQIQQFVDIQLSDNVKARYLDENGLIRVGAHVKEGDILIDVLEYPLIILVDGCYSTCCCTFSHYSYVLVAITVVITPCYCTIS